MPRFLDDDFHFMDTDEMFIEYPDEIELPMRTRFLKVHDFVHFCQKQPNGLYFENDAAAITVTFPEDGPAVKSETPIKLKIETSANVFRQQQMLNCHLFLPEGWTSSLGTNFAISTNFNRCVGLSFTELEITPGILNQMVYHAVLEVTPMGKANSIFVPLRFVNTNTVFAKAEDYDPNFGKN